MPHRLVRAEPLWDTMPALRERLDDGAVATMEPFGVALERGLERARYDPATGEAVWVEEDHCEPPLAMEREAVLDDHVAGLRVVDEDVDPDEARAAVAELPGLWRRVAEGV